MKKALKFIVPFLFSIVLAICFLPFYKDGRIILGSEGSYFLDFVLMFKSLYASWYNSMGGIFSVSLNFAYVFHLLVVQLITRNEVAVNFVMIYVQYFLPFLAVYLLAIQLGLSAFLALLAGIFYIANPFMLNFLKSINQWNMLAAYVIPSYLFIILRYFKQRSKLFLFFGLNSLLFAFTNANPPTMALYQIATSIFVVFSSLYYSKKLKIREVISSYFTVLSSFLLFNFWWIINWLYILPYASKSYSKQFALSWLRGSMSFVPGLWRSLGLTSLLAYPIDPDYDYLARYLSSPFSTLFISIPTVIIIYYFLRNKFRNVYSFFLVGVFILFCFFEKGVNGLFGFVYEYLIMNLPLFSIFKSANEKWGIIVTFLFSLFLIFSLKELKKDKKYSYVILGLIAYILYSFFPYLNGGFLPEAKVTTGIYHSKKFIDKPDYKNLRDSLNNDDSMYRVLSLPGSLNYQVALNIEGNKFFTGHDPILNNVDKPFLAPYNGTYFQRFSVLYDWISRSDYLNLFGFYNIKKIVIDKDIYPWFGFQEKESLVEIGDIFKDKISSVNYGVINLYDVGNYFLPKIYIPDKVIYSPGSGQKGLLLATQTDGFSRRTAVYTGLDRPEGVVVDEDNPFIEGESTESVLVGSLQTTVDELVLREGVKGLNPGGVLFPYARWKPGSVFYGQVRKKEQKFMDSIPDQESIFKQYLFFASKRIYEIQKWNKSLEDDIFSSILADYKSDMEKGISKLDEIAGRNIDTFMLLVQLEVTYSAHESRLISVVAGAQDTDRLKASQKVLLEVSNRISGLVNRHYSKPRYAFNIKEDSEYEIMSEKKDTPTLGPVSDLLTTGEEKDYSVAESSRDNWVSYGVHALTKGTHLFSFPDYSQDNLVGGNWRTGADNITAEGSIKLSGAGDIGYQEVANWEPDKTYLLSAKCKSTGGKTRIFVVENRNDKIDDRWANVGQLDGYGVSNPILVDRVYDTDGEWVELRAVFRSGRNSKSARLYVYNNPDVPLVESEFKDVKINYVYEPNLVLVRQGGKSYKTVPKITFQRVNPTKFAVDIESAEKPYFLVFSDSFHSGWKAFVDHKKTDNLTGGKTVAEYFGKEIIEKKGPEPFIDKTILSTFSMKTIPEDRHFVMNGYANSWYITPEDAEGKTNYRIILEYWPQKLVYFGFSVTILTIIASLSVCIGQSFRSKRNVTKN